MADTMPTTTGMIRIHIVFDIPPKYARQVLAAAAMALDRQLAAQGLELPVADVYELAVGRN
jgi:hypothetical protein